MDLNVSLPQLLQIIGAMYVREKMLLDRIAELEKAEEQAKTGGGEDLPRSRR